MPRQRHFDALIKVLIRYGVAREQIPQHWTPEVLKEVYAWIGRAVVLAELNPLPRRKKGRPKGSHAPDEMITPEGKRKRKERAKLWDDKISDEEFSRRFYLREEMKRKNRTVT
jgi:hypothetical protein